MTTVVKTLLKSVKLGEPVSDEGLTLIPMFASLPKAPPFLTLSEAIAKEYLVVTEKDLGGSVPELLARNDGPVGVLILDGEELSGAKQNRVLNTSVYLAPGKEITVPVSCTERGRWSYISDRFADSGHVAARRVRQVAHESVTAAVRTSGAYSSAQGRVWEEVEELQTRHGCRSETSAMKDVYFHRGASIGRRALRFEPQHGQCGVFAVWDGRVVGFDLVATAHAYAALHDRLIASYTIDALVQTGKTGKNDLRTAKQFVASLADAEATVHESPGDGESTRLTGPEYTGSVLAVDDAILHAVVFGGGE